MSNITIPHLTEEMKDADLRIPVRAVCASLLGVLALLCGRGRDQGLLQTVWERPSTPVGVAVRVVRSEDSRLEDMADPSAWGDLDENDPKSMGRFMRKMMSEMGDEAGELGPEFEEVVDRLEAGQDPEEIEKDMPDLMGEGAGPGMGPAGDSYSASDFDD